MPPKIGSGKTTFRLGLIANSCLGQKCFNVFQNLRNLKRFFFSLLEQIVLPCLPSNHLRHALFTFLLTTSWLWPKRCEQGNRDSACISSTSFSSELQMYLFSYSVPSDLSPSHLEQSTYFKLAFLPFVPKILMVPVTKWCMVYLSIQAPNLRVILFSSYSNDHFGSVSLFSHDVWTSPGIPLWWLDGCFFSWTLSCSLESGVFTVLAQALRASRLESWTGILTQHLVPL